MTAHALVTRRVLLRDMGKAGIAFVVMGTAACAEDPTSNATPTDEPDATSTSAASDPTTSAAEAPAPTEGATTSSPGETSSGHQWHRANLGFVSAYILYRDGEAALVDTGVEGSEAAIEAALAEVDLGWGDVGHLIVTHKHPDHQGSVEAVIAASEAPWYTGAGDIAEITASTEGTAVGDGDSVFDLQIIETPGHTAGHIAVLDTVGGVLVTGDALSRGEGALAGSPPQFTEDTEMANASVVKMAGFDYEIALFGHGEPILEGASAEVAALAETLNG